MKMGRKSKYETHVKPFLDRIPSWRKDGLTELQVGKKLGISEDTLHRYKKLHSEFYESLKNGKELLIENLKESLFKRAMGYKVEETKQIFRKTKKGQDAVYVERYTREVYSDTCLIFALKNLDPENWKDRREIQQDINQTVQHLTIDIIDEEGKEIDTDKLTIDEEEVNNNENN